MAKELDLYDRKILFALDINSRTKAAAISREIRLPKETVNFRIKRLLKNKYIHHFYTMINASKLGYGMHKIFLKFNNMTTEIEKQVIDFLLNEKTCANLRITEGAYDICFLTMNKNPSELKDFMCRFCKRFGEYLMQRSMHTLVSSIRLNQKFLYLGTSVRKTINHGDLGNYSLNKIELEIIKIISTNARKKLVDIANETGQDPKVISYHIGKLEQNGIIAGYFTALNARLLNRSLVQVDIALRNPDKYLAIIEFFDHTGMCAFASEMLGRYDLTIELYVENDLQLRKVMSKFKKSFGGYLIFYEVSRIYQEYVINWSPYDGYSSGK